MTWFWIVLVLAAGGLGWSLGRWPPTGPRFASRTREAPASADLGGVADIVEHHPEGIVVADLDGRIIYRNVTSRGVAGGHHGVLLDEAIEGFVADLVQESDDAEGGRTIELYGPPKIVFKLVGFRLREAVAVFVRDLTEQRRSKQVHTDFVANISHELKTPIGALVVLAEALDGEADPEAISRVAARLGEEAQRASRTVDDLMELSRIEVGGDRQVEAIPVAEVVRAALDRMRETASQRGIGLTSFDPVDAEGGRASLIMVEGDRRQLVSAVGNLVENAVKYSEPGGAVQVKVVRVGDRVEIVVADRGIGIPQKDLDRIFERFYRVDRARSRDTGGSGLGLSIVRHVAAHHGGEITVTSVEGDGSTFVLGLPIAMTSDAVEAPLDDDREEIA